MKKEQIPENYIFFWREKGEKKSSIIMNYALKNLFPIEGFFKLLIIEIDFLEPLDNGFLGKEESYIMYDIEDYIIKEFVGKGTISAGTLKGNGKMKLYFYFGDENINFKEILNSVFEEFPDYKYNFEIKEDKNGKIYEDDLMPNRYEYQTVSNRSVMSHLYDMGDIPEEEREINHFIIFDKKDDSDLFLEEVIKEGYILANQGKNDAGKYFLNINRNDNLLEEEIHNKIELLVKLAEKNNGEYDGWETFLVLPEVDEKSFNYLGNRRAKFYSRKTLEELKDLVNKEDNYAISAFVDNLDNGKITFEEMSSVIEPIAEKGNMIAQYKLGYWYDKEGKIKKAIYWSEKATQNGHIIGMGNLRRYAKENGLYTIELIKRNIDSIRKSAEEGYHEAESELIKCLTFINPDKKISEIPEILKYLELNSKKGGWAYHNLACDLKFDFKRYDEAIIYYEKAIEQYEEKGVTYNPYTWSLTQLADIYEEEGFIDEDKNFYYKKRASDLGDVDAMYDLAIMYKNGIGCKINKQKSLELLDDIINENFDYSRGNSKAIINKVIELKAEIETELEDEEVENDVKEMKETLKESKKDNWIFKLINFFKGKK